MGLFNLFKKSAKPYKNDGLNLIYDLLFCDNIDLFKSNGDVSGYPWDILFAENVDIDALMKITEDKTLESRQRVLAYNKLLAKGISIDKKELLGIILEVSMPYGLDVLAAFSDGTARYINYSGKMIVWETQTEASEKLISKLFSDSEKLIGVLGPWDKPRKPFPRDMSRISFLVSDGLYFGEGPKDALHNDPISRNVMDDADMLMAFLVGQVNKT